MPDESGPSGPRVHRPPMATGDGRLSAERLTRLRDVLAGYVERREVAGLVSLVSRRGEAHVEAMGGMSYDGAQPMHRDSIFRISSMTKPVTAAAAMILVEECKLRLDEPVDRLLPELADRKVLRRFDGPLDDTVPASRPITLRDLLTFTFGFGFVFPMDVPIMKAAVDAGVGMGPPMPSAMPAPDDWMRRLGSLPLMFQPGERWLYQTGADVVGVLVARASGQPFESFLRERVFEPLGMKDTPSACRSPRSAVCRSATGRSGRRALSRSMTKRKEASGAARRRSLWAAQGWSRRQTTTWPSRRCCSTVACSTAGASSPGRPSS